MEEPDSRLQRESTNRWQHIELLAEPSACAVRGHSRMARGAGDTDSAAALVFLPSIVPL